MSSFTIGVNMKRADDGGATKNTVRFETISQRLQRINVDILHKTEQTFAPDLSASIEDGAIVDCYIRHELDKYRKLETTRHYIK